MRGMMGWGWCEDGVGTWGCWSQVPTRTVQSEIDSYTWLEILDSEESGKMQWFYSVGTGRNRGNKNSILECELASRYFCQCLGCVGGALVVFSDSKSKQWPSSLPKRTLQFSAEAKFTDCKPRLFPFFWFIDAIKFQCNIWATPLLHLSTSFWPVW